MPNGYDYSKEYGPHKYARHDGTSDCEYGCNCWAGPANSGGPVGLDPLGGECPKNPKDGKLVGGSVDYQIVVTRRIRKLESDLYDAREKAEELEKIVVSKKRDLFRQYKSIRKELRKKNKLLTEIHEKIEKQFMS